jgi:hypothetical protein
MIHTKPSPVSCQARAGQPPRSPAGAMGGTGTNSAPHQARPPCPSAGHTCRASTRFRRVTRHCGRRRHRWGSAPPRGASPGGGGLSLLEDIHAQPSPDHRRRHDRLRHRQLRRRGHAHRRRRLPHQALYPRRALHHPRARRRSARLRRRIPRSSATASAPAPPGQPRRQLARHGEALPHPLQGRRHHPPVLIVGESGTGKELVARSIHTNGPNANKPFLPVDCGSLAPAMIERRALRLRQRRLPRNQPRQDRPARRIRGRHRLPRRDRRAPPRPAGRLLRALQEKEVRPIGSDQAVPITARILAATNRDLTQLVETGRFRKDLYFRLNVVTLRIPALRERRSDIPLLAAHILERMKARARHHLHLRRRSPAPAHGIRLARQRPRARARHRARLLPLQRPRPPPRRLPHPDAGLPVPRPQTLQQRWSKPVANARAPISTPSRKAHAVLSIADLEKQRHPHHHPQLHGDKLMAARLLGIGKTTLYRKLKEYGLEEQFSA